MDAYGGSDLLLRGCAEVRIRSSSLRWPMSKENMRVEHDKRYHAFMS
jgi:hypothetical protein